MTEFKSFSDGVVDIYYFSGTGNTRLVVKAMAEVFRESGVTTRMFRIEETDPRKIDLAHTIGLAFPVAIQSTYPLVWDFIEKMPQGQRTGVFMVDTLAAFSGGVIGPLRSILQKKRYYLLGAKEIRMPSNNFPKRINPEKNETKIKTGMKKAREFAASLIKGTARWRRVPLISDLICALSRSNKAREYLKRRGSHLTVDQAKCSRCQSCVELCPVGNISMEDYPIFIDRCQQCMRCISFCPTGAIAVLGKTYEIYRAAKLGEMLGDNT
jgi:NAD-dependent dihydropyrimidine dehydrogenase PreA subunit